MLRRKTVSSLLHPSKWYYLRRFLRSGVWYAVCLVCNVLLILGFLSKRHFELVTVIKLIGDSLNHMRTTSFWMNKNRHYKLLKFGLTCCFMACVSTNHEVKHATSTYFGPNARVLLLQNLNDHYKITRLRSRAAWWRESSAETQTCIHFHQTLFRTLVKASFSVPIY